MPSSAQLFRLQAGLTIEALATAAEVVMQAWRTTGDADPIRVRAPGASWQTDGPIAEPPAGRGLELEVGDERGIGVLVRKSERTSLVLSLHLSEVAPEQRGTQLARLVQMARELTMRGAVEHATVGRQAGGESLPQVPLAGTSAHVVVASEAAMAEGYDDPERFRAAWDLAERIERHWFLARALDAPDNPAFLARVMAPHLDMVAAAKAGQVAFFPPLFEEGEEEVWTSGLPTVHPVGYDTSTQVAELAAHPADGPLLRPADLQLLWEIVSRGTIEAGPVQQVRVVFAHEGQARGAIALLRHVGARAAYEDAHGETHVLPDRP